MHHESIELFLTNAKIINNRNVVMKRLFLHDCRMLMMSTGKMLIETYL